MILLDVNTDATRTRASSVVKIILFDPYTLTLVENQTISVSSATGRVLDVSPQCVPDGRTDDQVIDLSALTVLPGFVDAHVHLFLHPYSETSWGDQLARESITRRTYHRATVHAKRTLLAGFTTVRDLGTEGAADADIALRKCLSSTHAHTNPPLIPGPRYFCASRAIAPTGSYGPKGTIHVNREGVDGITGAEVADGRDDCVKTVRRQIGAGADWIKIYADYRVRSRMGGVSAETGRASMNTFNEEELRALVEERTHVWSQGGSACDERGDDHKIVDVGRGFDRTWLRHFYGRGHGYGYRHRSHRRRALARSNTKWVPTLAAYYTLSQGSGDAGPCVRAAEAFKAALRKGMENIACGGDTGVFVHGANALEMVLMVRLGADWRRVLRWGALGGWECVRSMGWEGRRRAARLARAEAEGEVGNARDGDGDGDNEVPFGAIRRGFAADVIATCGDVAGDFEGAVSAECIRFVKKGGRVYKRDGRAVE